MTEPSLKTSRVTHTSPSLPIKKTPSLLMSAVPPIYNIETQYAVVKHVSKKNKWNLIIDPVSGMNFDIAWVDGITKLDIFQKMSSYQKINHFPGTFSSY